MMPQILPRAIHDAAGGAFGSFTPSGWERGELRWFYRRFGRARAGVTRRPGAARYSRLDPTRHSTKATARCSAGKEGPGVDDCTTMRREQALRCDLGGWCDSQVW